MKQLMGDNGQINVSHPTHRVNLTPQTIRNLTDLCAMVPSQAVTEELIQVYFSEANWYFALLEKHYFERLYSSWYALHNYTGENLHSEQLSRDLLYFPALIFQVLAVALQFAPLDLPSVQALGADDLARRDCISSDFSTRGMDIARIVGGHDPSIVAVQNDIMRALWLKNSSRGREAWHMLGSAIRLAFNATIRPKSISNYIFIEWLRI